MKLFSFKSMALIMMVVALFCPKANAAVIDIPLHLHAKASYGKTLSAMDFESQEIVNRNLDAYLVIDRVECKGASIRSGDYGIFITPTKQEAGFVRFFIKRSKSVCLTRGGIVANNYSNLPKDPALVKLIVNDKEIAITQPDMAAQHNNTDTYSTCLSEKFTGIPLDCIEVHVPYIEGIDNSIQMIKLRLVYTEGDQEITELEFAEKEHVGYLSESYEMPALKAWREEHLRFVTLSSSDDKVAAIVDGKVKLKGEGKAIISARIAGVASIVDTKEASYNLTVYKDRESGVEEIDTAPEKWIYFDLEGRKLSSRPTAPGVYIARSGSRSIKFIIPSNR